MTALADKFRTKLARSALLAQAEALGVVLVSMTERGVVISSAGCDDEREVAAQLVAEAIEDLVAADQIHLGPGLRGPV